VESDKATVPITSRYDGTIVKLHYEEGDLAKTGEQVKTRLLAQSLSARGVV
jgi:pyruvate/2-oxoglutarate dehydrogenase complex dihydrolipoamide acyltransferase (E2) component